LSITLFYASDIHGSDVLWRKFINAGKFYGANVLVMGGDVAGKAIVPITRTSQGYLIPHQARTPIRDEAELVAAEKSIRDHGFYPYRTTSDELETLNRNPEALDRVFAEAMRASLESWVALAEDRLRGTGISLYVMMGNDDEPSLRDVIRRSDVARDPEDVVVDLGGDFTMISCGWANKTPWNSPREMSEEDLLAHLEEHVAAVPDPKRSVFNLHVPPFASGLDQAPALDDTLKPVVTGGMVMSVPVGSKAVRTILERYQPLVALHGHIHESRGEAKVGRTVCINPGSEYTEGVLHGAILVLDQRKGLKAHQLVSG
jgi:uncharacterized protein